MGAREGVGRVRMTRTGFLFALTLGLSFTNHMTTILLAPALLFWFFHRLGFSSRSLRRVMLLAPPFMAGLLPYLYLPLRAAASPRFNWGDPETPWAFWRHLTGAQFGVWMFDRADTVVEQSNHFARLIGADLAYVGLIVCAAGVVYLSRGRRLTLVVFPAVLTVFALLFTQYHGSSLGALLGGAALLAALLVALAAAPREHRSRTRYQISTNVFLALLFITGATYAGGYSIVDIEPYYAIALVPVGVWLAAGLIWFRHAAGTGSTLALAAILAVVVLVAGFTRSDRHDSREVELATNDMLSALPENSLVISGLWDYWVSGSYYRQGAEGARPDVAVIDHNLIKRSWYLKELQQWFPDLMAPVRHEVEVYRQQLYKFEHDLPYDSRTIDAAYVALIDSIMAKASKNRPVYITWDLMSEAGAAGTLRYGSSYHWIPDGLAFRLQKSGEYRPVRFPDWSMEFSSDRPDLYDGMMRFWYATMAVQRAAYEQRHGKAMLADRYRTLARSFDPGWSRDDFHDNRSIVSDRIDMMMAAFSGLRR
jgi:hypothetical protein